MKNLHRHMGPVDPRQKSKWIVVGDASRFIVFKKEKAGALEEVRSFTNEKAHQKISDLEKDQPGRTFASHTQSHGGHQTGAPRHAYVSEQDPKARATEDFVNEVASFLDHALTEHSFEKLVLIANDRLLGMLRPALNKATQATICQAFAKDFAWITGTELHARVEALLRL